MRPKADNILNPAVLNALNTVISVKERLVLKLGNRLTNELTEVAAQGKIRPVVWFVHIN